MTMAPEQFTQSSDTAPGPQQSPDFPAALGSQMLLFDVEREPGYRCFQVTGETRLEVCGWSTDDEPTIRVLGDVVLRGDDGEIIMAVQPRDAPGRATKIFRNLTQAGLALEDDIAVRWFERHTDFIPEPEPAAGDKLTVNGEKVNTDEQPA